jgi:adenylosuccinate lyase
MEIVSKADIQFAPADDIAEEYKVVQHRMVALLNVWGRALGGDAAQYLHFGATTVDIYDTVLVLQLLGASELIINKMLAFESALLILAEAHKDTVMMGRTLGQHALPITFGKKVSVWLGENRRHIERMRRVQSDLKRSAILKGAVGSYLGLGEQAIEVEAAFASALGMSSPYISDWHGTRDVFADYARVLGMAAKSNGRIGQELFLLQTTDINETVEYRPATVVGSSTMPHKNNPRKTEALIQYSRSIPRLAEVVQDDIQNHFERDNTSRPNRVLASISLEADAMYRTVTRLIAELKVNKTVMRQNVDKTRGLMLSQRLAFALAEKIGKTEANHRLHDVAKQALENELTLREAFRQSDLSDLLDDKTLDELLEPTTYIGLASQQTELVISEIRQLRSEEGAL